MHFYLQSSFLVEGINRAEIAEWLVEHAESEFKHIQQFAKMIVGLGGTPTTEHHYFPSFTCPFEIFEYAQQLEQQVVTNYVHRMEEMEEEREVDKVDRKYVGLFLEDQVLDSRADLDEIGQFLKRR
jgi:bacterioferritin (cytochrome b1)